MRNEASKIQITGNSERSSSTAVLAKNENPISCDGWLFRRWGNLSDFMLQSSVWHFRSSFQHFA
jgi:hypothetical protein